MPRLLVLQHVAVEHPGILREFMRADGIEWDTVELDCGETIPPLAGYAGLIVMGGPMDTWEEDLHPWLVAEKSAIREAVVERQLPYLGVCLGHQLLAAALGGHVGKAARSEVGVMPVGLTPSGKRHPLLAGFADAFDCLQWHGAEVVVAPPGAQVLAQSPACRVQALACGPRALGIQFHVEVLPQTVDEWYAIPTYAEALHRNLGQDGVPAFKQAAVREMANFNRMARVLYDNWRRVAF